MYTHMQALIAFEVPDTQYSVERLEVVLPPAESVCRKVRSCSSKQWVLTLKKIFANWVKMAFF